MKIAIVGYGLQGESVYEYYKGSDNQITICDQNLIENLPADVESQLGSSYLNRLDRFDLIFRGPIIRPDDIVKANSPEILSKVTTNTNDFFKLCPTKNIIGVTGTKGKGTTSTLIAKVLEEVGLRVHLGGNIGIPPLDLLREDIKSEDWVVLELANFQLIDLKYSPKIAVCLMVVPEHLDWHGDADEYYRSKAELFRHQEKTDMAIYYAKNENSTRIATTSPGIHIPYCELPGALVAGSHITIDGIPIVRINELRLLGKHNWQNVCAAVTACWQITHDQPAIRNVLTSFEGLEHRLELVAKVNGVGYYDDSFGTTPATAIVAVEAFNVPKVVILGGSDKGSSYDELAETVKSNNVRSVVLIGEQGPRIAEALKKQGFTQTVPGGPDMTSIISVCKSQAQPGDVVLLSPACASFDMFKNYKDRGEQFKQAVLKLVASV